MTLRLIKSRIQIANSQLKKLKQDLEEFALEIDMMLNASDIDIQEQVGNPAVENRKLHDSNSFLQQQI